MSTTATDPEEPGDDRICQIIMKTDEEAEDECSNNGLKKLDCSLRNSWRRAEKHLRYFCT